MFPFWDLVIAPVITSAASKRIVEIGALRGETTVRMLAELGPDAEVHVIDPVPDFDPAEHERAFPGRYLFYRDLSLNVLPHLPPVDVALIDGDHNWYTVYHELRALTDVARAAGAPLPVMILHDVCWPYGRRDLYYNPATIPEEHRQPYARQGMKKGKKRLLPRGGLNPTLDNALVEGGPRNGVMTAVDDWIAEHDRPLRRVVLPIYFGLAIVVEEERLDRQPALRALLDQLESADGRLALMELAEDVRLNAMLFQHNVFYQRERQLERAAQRYLDLLKGALLDEHYVENEVRLAYLATRLERGRLPEEPKLRDPVRYMRDETRAALDVRRTGQSPTGAAPVAYFPYTTMGRIRLDALHAALETVRTDAVAGDLVECGTGRGGGAIFLRGYLEAHEISDRRVYVADEFRARPRTGDATVTESTVPFGGPGFPDLLADLNNVRDAFDRFGLLDDQVAFLQGRFDQTLPDAPIERIALLRIGPEAAPDAGSVLEALAGRLSQGAVVLVEGYDDPRVREAVDDARSRLHTADPLERVDATTVRWRSSAVPQEGRTEPVRADRPPLAPALATGRKDLSVVVVFYNMRREAERTLHSLSRAYQRDVDDLDYEVIVVDNGSDPTERLDEAWVRSFGPEFRFLDMGAEAPSSPVEGLNQGIRLAAGEHLALMIDGAHVLTPGVLRYGIEGLRTYAPAIVATQQWYVGPGQQGDAMMSGYDQAYEDRLFTEIAWPADGYRLFEIGHFIGDRDWFDGVWESNCIFASRAQLEQVGCFDESFSMPGGGYANLEIYERLGSAPDVRVVSILGEGSFHQLHGGTTTNQDDADERRRRVSGYAQHFAEIRGRTFRGPGKRMHYIGSMPPKAIRTKARRRLAPNLFNQALPDPEGIPEQPAPIPEELRVDFTDAFWRSLAWRGARWLGQRVDRAPTDLFAYQELLATVRPDWIIETRTGNGGRALFLASICDLLGHGQVVTLDAKDADARPRHPRITPLVGDVVRDEMAARVRELVGPEPHAVVVLGRGTRQRVAREFELYAPFVPVGSYVVVEDTIVNGHPVWPSFGAGPAEAVKGFMNTRGDFAPDPTFEKYGLTFNPNGFLKRLA